MGTTQRKEQRKMKLEKEIIRLTKLHQNKDVSVRTCWVSVLTTLPVR